MKVYIGTDHRGVETQNKIVNYLKDLGIDINISKLKHNDKWNDYKTCLETQLNENV